MVRNVHVYVLYVPLHDTAPHIQALPCFSLFDTERLVNMGRPGYYRLFLPFVLDTSLTPSQFSVFQFETWWFIIAQWRVWEANRKYYGENDDSDIFWYAKQFCKQSEGSEIAVHDDSLYSFNTSIMRYGSWLWFTSSIKTAWNPLWLGWYLTLSMVQLA